MTEDTLLPFDLPAVSRNKVTADFAGGSISSDGGLVLLRAAERGLGLAGCIREWRAGSSTACRRCCASACSRSGAGEPVPGSAEPVPGNDADALRQAPERRAARRSAVQAGGRPGAGERARSLFPAHHEPAGERALAHRGGAHDGRYIVTSLKGEPRHLYERTYCARGQAENLIKQHKAQLASDRTSCQSPLANQFRLILHTAAYWLMLALRDAVPRRMPLHWAEFATLRQKLLKIRARVVEKAARVRIHFASACPDAALFRMLTGRLAASGP